MLPHFPLGGGGCTVYCLMSVICLVQVVHQELLIDCVYANPY